MADVSHGLFLDKSHSMAMRVTQYVNVRQSMSYVSHSITISVPYYVNASLSVSYVSYSLSV